MPSNLIGVDLGSRELKLVLRKGRELRGGAVHLPENINRDGQLQIKANISEVIASARATLGVPKGTCALLLPDSASICRLLRVPAMSKSQLELNLPYEFRDYISGNADDYFYDYAVVSMEKDENDAPRTLILLAAAALKSSLNDYYHMFRRAGLKIKYVQPREMVYLDLIRGVSANDSEPVERCFIDLGGMTTRVTIFKGEELTAARTIDYGVESVVSALAQHENIDEYLADVRLKSDADGAQSYPCCDEVYHRIAVELLKSVNFYRYNNQSSDLKLAYFTGGGAAIAPLIRVIADVTELEPKDMTELIDLDFPRGPENAAPSVYALAAAITMHQGGDSK